MSSTSGSNRTQLPTAEVDLTADELFSVLSDRRRRCVLSALYREDDRLTRESLTAELAHGTQDDPREAAVHLHHLVLPKLEGTTLVSCPNDELVALTSDGSSVATWLDAVT
ncbi:hypothetical protein [Salinigranum halophilum]|jgi:hypothetical protein|uniref:hypothetical protein n=1 Tax=Salinigranum halophilum TaxID=2565931 RepID=UPI00115E631F|nr:hypothetical protein [Salinigranum halophilum]